MKKINQQKLIYPIMLGYAILSYAAPGFASDLNPLKDVTDFNQLIESLLTTLMSFLGVIATIFLVYAGFKYVTAGGDSKKAGEAKEAITHAIIGVAVALIGYLLVKFVFSTIGAKENLSNF